MLVFLIDLSATSLCRFWIEDEARNTQARSKVPEEGDDDENWMDNNALGVETKNYFVA